MLERLTSLIGKPVLSIDQRVGQVRDLLFDDDCGQVLYLDAGAYPGEHTRRLVPAACLVPTIRGSQALKVELTKAQLQEFNRVLQSAPVTQRARSAVQLLARRVPTSDREIGTIVDVLVDIRDWTVDYVLTQYGPLALSASLVARLARANLASADEGR